MPIWGWVCVGLFILSAIVGIVEAIRKSRTTSRVMNDGERVVAHVVVADDKLYVPSNPDAYPGCASANVVFTLDDTLSDEHYAKLEAYAELLRNYTAADSSTEEQTLASLKKATSCTDCTVPVLLPDRLTGGEEVYAASTDVYWKLLSEGCLTQPYIHCKVLVGPGGGVRMVESPPTDWVPSPAATDPTATTSDGQPAGTPAYSRVAMLAAARALYAENYSPKAARKKLLEAGCAEADVDDILDDAWGAHVGAQRSQGFVELVVGALLLAAGIWVTSASYREAEASGGGTYVVTTGLIICGVYGFFRGTVRLIGGR
jgi:hypothetical protein